MRYVPVIAIAAAAGLAQAQTGTIDQSSPHHGGANGAQFNVGWNFLNWQQQIRPAVSGQLEGIRISHISGVAGTSFRLAIRHGAAISTNPVLFETIVTHSAPNTRETVFINMTGANYMVTAGVPFVIELTGLVSSGNEIWILGSRNDGATGDPFYPEPLFLNGSEFSYGWRIGFDTFVFAGVGCSADFNDDGVVDFFDYIDFLSAFTAEDDSADFNNTDSIDFFDYLDFVDAFSMGC